MRHKLIFILLLMSVFAAVSGQPSKNDQFKKKNQGTGNIAGQNQSAAYLHGKITDANGNVLPGVSVWIVGTKKGVNANENGEYFLYDLPAGKINLQASVMGFRTRSIEITAQPGQNDQNFTLDEENIHLEPVTVVAQKREQQILDVPASIGVVGSDFIAKSNITELGQLSVYVPGLFITEQGANRPSFIIRGLTSEEVSPSAQPRVSVYQNNVPINRANGASVELFDMERVEVLKGPQNTLFGRGAQIGAIHFISKSPDNKTDGYVTAGFGNYNQKEFRGAINMPVLKNKLFIRAAGVYDFRDGYVSNTFGGTLNGKKTTAGRFSVRYLPTTRQKLDLVVNYQKDDTPGIAFMSKQFPNTLGETDIFKYHASLEQGKNLGTGKEILDATLTYKYLINEHTYWSSVSSYRKTTSSARWDGDGTAAAAIDMSENAGANQFYQEIRYNFSLKSRLNGSAGASYWHEKANQTYWFSPNEQNMVHLFLNPAYLIMPNGQPLALPALPNIPQLGPLAGMPLPASHQENNYSTATNQASEAFADVTYQIVNGLFFNGGIRAAYEKFELSNEAAFIGGSPSTLGMMTGNYPNLFFKPSTAKSMDANSFSVNWQAGLQYKINENTNVFANYSNGRRPKVLQYTSAGIPEVLRAEKVNNFDVGIKASVARRLFVDLVGFYQKYNDFQTRAWVADPTSGEFNYKSKDGGKATTYGAEISLKASLLKGLDVYGNYALLNATFDDTDSDGSKQEYAGNTFRLSPKSSFAVGFNAHTNLTPNIQLFLNPSYSYKTHFYFEDANTAGLEQSAYGLLNMNCGIELADPKVMLSIFSTNMLNEKFIISAGNTGSLFGVPTFVPGPPRMAGTKLTWRF
jgi:outer membrane receptor protein involved in Fe transport